MSGTFFKQCQRCDQKDREHDDQSPHNRPLSCRAIPAMGLATGPTESVFPYAETAPVAPPPAIRAISCPV